MLRAQALYRQQEGYEQPWVIVTDLLPAEVEAAWYRMRYWIEGGFKDFKRGGWGWQHTKMLDAQRADRLWLAMAVAALPNCSPPRMWHG